MTDIFEHIEAKRKHYEAEYQFLAYLTGMTIEELDADLTAPDPIVCDY